MKFMPGTLSSENIVKQISKLNKEQGPTALSAGQHIFETSKTDKNILTEMYRRRILGQIAEEADWQERELADQIKQKEIEDEEKTREKKRKEKKVFKEQKRELKKKKREKEK